MAVIRVISGKARRQRIIAREWARLDQTVSPTLGPQQIFQKIEFADLILAEGGDVAAVLRELNMKKATYCRCRHHYGDLKAEEAKKLKHQENQHDALKKLLA